jgi:two-component system response regulator
MGKHEYGRLAACPESSRRASTAELKWSGRLAADKWRYESMSATTLVKPIEILLVEDNPGDADLAREALENSKVHNTLQVVGDGVEAMAFLRRKGKYAAVPRPDLVLLDLNLPKKDGREVLAEIKADPDLKRIPVVILTISKDEEDILKTYNLHANCFITKPIDLNQFLKVVKAIEDFWLSIVKLPPNGAKK